jgi:choline dehydrogenase-like flavoprotein
MIVDGREVEPGGELVTDVCIIGAGPAGISLANELDGSGLDVCLLESGGLDLDRRADALNDLEDYDGDFTVPNGTRRRQFGGSSNMWMVRLRRMSNGARYLPLSEIDFEQRDWVPHSGWPFGRADLDPYYRRAHPVCGLGPYEHDPEVWSAENAGPLPLDASRVATAVEHFGAGDVFNEVLGDVLRRSANVRVVLHANVTELRQRAGATEVEGVSVACFDGTRFDVRARTYVVATGAIETARLLLLSNHNDPAGIGNEHDLVGRFYMDHLWVSCGRLVPRDPALMNRMGLYDLRTVRGSMIRAKLTLSDELSREHEILNSALELLPKPQSEIYASIRSLREIARSVRNRQRPEDLGQKVRAIVPGAKYLLGTGTRLAISQRRIPPSVDAGWSDLPHNDRRFETLAAIQQIELAPDPDNRVTLADELDELGQRRARLDWRFTELDVRSARRGQLLYAEEVARSGVGELELPDPDADLEVLSPVGIYHQVGTARMHDDPARGVVDRNCRVHSVPNLYLAGGAVFPTGGYANCTLTIVALSIRLADHVKRQLGAR